MGEMLVGPVAIAMDSLVIIKSQTAVMTYGPRYQRKKGRCARASPPQAEMG